MSNDPLTTAGLPESVGDLVKTSIEQAKRAFDTFVSTNDKTWKSLEISSLATTQSLRLLNEKIADITRTNADANFQLAIDLAEAGDVQKAMELQNQHARKQLETFSAQLEEVRDLAVEIVLEANSSTRPPSPAAIPTPPPRGQPIAGTAPAPGPPQSMMPPNRAPQSEAPAPTAPVGNAPFAPETVPGDGVV